MRELPITVLILTKNEELAIAECLDSVKNFSQVIVIDSNSTDLTIEIVKSFKRDFVFFTWNGKYPKKKQWSLQLNNILNDWVLFLDADERVTAELNEELFRIFNSEQNFLKNISAFEISLQYRFMGRILKYGHKVRKIALINRQKCDFPVFDDLQVKNMWEVEGHYQPTYQGNLAKTRSNIFHNDPDGLFDYFSRHNRYSDWEAAIQVSSFTKQSIRNQRSFQGRMFGRAPFRSVLFFIYSYILKLGFMDGRAGLDYALAQSFYYWQISAKVREIKFSAQAN